MTGGSESGGWCVREGEGAVAKWVGGWVCSLLESSCGVGDCRQL